MVWRDLRRRRSHSTNLDRETGFTLLETTVALAIAGLALFASLSGVLQYRLTKQRLEGQKNALRSLSSAHEMLRSGYVELRDGPLLAPLPSVPGQTSPSVSVLVERVGASGLLRVTLTSTYHINNAEHEQNLETLFWRP